MSRSLKTLKASVRPGQIYLAVTSSKQKRSADLRKVQVVAKTAAAGYGFV